jgi:hypothetical protein
MSHYDDIAGRDLPDIDDLIEKVEDGSDDLESFLTNKLRRIASEPTLPLPPIADLPDARIAAMAKPGYIADGTKPSMQDNHREGEVPVPIISDLEPSATAINNGLQDSKTVLELRSHPIVGAYVAESQEVANDDWYADVFLNTKKLAVSEMTAEQIIDTIHKNEEAVRRIKAGNNGLRAALEEQLTSMNATERAKILEKDRTYRVKKIKGDEKRAEEQKAKKVGKKVLSPIEKMIKNTYIESFGFNKAEVLKELSDRGKLTDDLKSFVDSLFPAQ